MMISMNVAKLKIPLDEVIVVGSGVMEELGLRKSNDIDLCVTPRLFELLAIRPGWHTMTFPDNNRGLVYRDKDYEYEAMESFGGTLGAPNFDQLRAATITLNGVLFLSPEYLLSWKLNKNRPKDRTDIELLQAYLNST